MRSLYKRNVFSSILILLLCSFYPVISNGGSLSYSTYLGGTGDDYIYDIAVDSFGNTYVVGETGSTNFSCVNAYQSIYGGGYRDAFITKFDSSGNVIYSTFLGGNSTDIAYGISTDSFGNIYIVGYTASDDFPLMNAYQTEKAGGGDVFIAKLNADGNALLFSTYLGGLEADKGMEIAVDQIGNAYITGWTRSTNFPTSNAFQNSHAGGQEDGFISKLNTIDGTLVYSSYIGGGIGPQPSNGNDESLAIAASFAMKAYPPSFKC